MTQDEIIEMARQAGFKMENSAAIQAAETFAKLVAAKERKSNFHNLGFGEMELRLICDRNGELFQHRHKFSADQVMQSTHLPSTVAIKAKIMSAEIEEAIRARGQE